ncbi:uncharacterized protein KY384_001739 [Bacidia gigantensis]|uniref:uncharacterized protein n=1 Tax=Bacidia gigantensis TaxID=2732470 RepID=UPI001D05583F|nr:uncharacterized protein KY384_001739 [Bacidia gigantensis]KAG8532958.1 hypothetical protein KY384_001739 [Bacidia gigantensis]
MTGKWPKELSPFDKAGQARNLPIGSALRCLRLARACFEYYGFYRHKSRTYRGDRRYTSADVTVVVPTIESDENFVNAVRSWIACNPCRIIVVTTDAMMEPMRNTLARLDDSNISLRSAPKQGKRLQMVVGLKEVATEIVVFVDDDVEWKPATLEGLLAGLDDPQTGGVQTCQRVRPNHETFTLWEMFGAARLSQRNVYCASSAFWNDGDVLNLSGRTTAYKTRCLQTPEFYEAFTQDYWRGKYHLKSGDDCFITSWIRHRGWKTWYQGDKEVEVVTTMKADRLYLNQLVRWSRNNARYWWRDFRFVLRQGGTRNYRRVLLNWTTAYHTWFFSLVDFLYFCYLILTFVSSSDSIKDDKA